MQLVQTRLLVRRFSEQYDFYAHVLGLSPQRGDRTGRYEKFSFPVAGAAIALQAREDVEAVIPLTERDVSLVAIKVDDLDAAAQQLVGRGATLLAPPAARYGGLKTAYLRDPEGNLLELQQW
jgi:predicted enzyme related to lactoylglutathione lyase